MRKRLSEKWEKADKCLRASGPAGAWEAFDKQSTYEPQCPQERRPKTKLDNEGVNVHLRESCRVFTRDNAAVDPDASVAFR